MSQATGAIFLLKNAAPIPKERTAPQWALERSGEMFSTNPSKAWPIKINTSKGGVKRSAKGQPLKANR